MPKTLCSCGGGGCECLPIEFLKRGGADLPLMGGIQSGMGMTRDSTATMELHEYEHSVNYAL